MTLLIFNGGGGGGGNNNLRRDNGSGNSAVIKGTVVLLLVWSFVGVCGGKPFHSIGQAEVEEDTTQGSMKEKFPIGFSLRSPVASFGNDVNGLDGEDGGDNSDLDLVALGNDRNGGDVWPSSSSSLNKDEHLRQHHLLRHLSIPSNYGIVHKRSLGLSPLSFSTDSRDLAGRNDADDDPDGDERGDLGRGQQRRHFSSSSSALPIYGQSSSVGGGGGGSPSSDMVSSSGESNPSSRIRQRLLNLRNQYGDKWFAFGGPYAYRKRQILYRQCFFNPISCF